MKSLTAPSLLLPRDARDALIAASKIGEPFTAQREEAIAQATAEVCTKYPQFYPNAANTGATK